MSDRFSYKAGLISSIVMASVFGGTLVATAMMWLLGDWDSWGLTLALRIVWGCCVVICLAAFLTRVTIFGWSFRRYFRLEAEGDTATPPPRSVIPRPAKAPWYKSGAASFSITVTLVSITGAIAVAVVVMWILKDVVGKWVFELVTGILIATWWVSVIAVVLMRVALFRSTMKKALRPGESLGNGAEGEQLPNPEAEPDHSGTTGR
jgi:hypothetical protein